VALPQVDHLILLVGKNPVPNVVAARAMAAPGGHVTLMATPGVAREAAHIQAHLEAHGLVAAAPQVEESQPESIARGVLQVLQGSAGGESVGLNYTGGTKAMAVHACGAAQNWARDTRREVTFSYLDARNNRMLWHGADVLDGALLQSESVARAVPLSLKELVELHGWKVTKDGTPDPPGSPPLLATARAIGALYNSDAGRSAWRDWLEGTFLSRVLRSPVVLQESVGEVVALCEAGAGGEAAREWADTQFLPRMMRQVVSPDDRKFRPNGELRALEIPLPTSAECQGVADALRADLGFEDGLPIAVGTQTLGLRRCEDFCKWIDGQWLETLTYDALVQNQEAWHLHDVAMSFEVTGQGSTKFEFDVAAMRGHQLFAVTCSTYERHGPLKNKLFEGATHAPQMGGEEAAIALCCCASDPEAVQSEVQRMLAVDSRFRVFGRRDIASLSAKLHGWIS
jgi:hypothetical protein